MWYSAGARTLEDVLAGKGGIKLTPQQQVGIRHYDGKPAFPSLRTLEARAQSDLVCLVVVSYRFC